MQSRGEFLLPGGKAEKEWAKHSYVQLSTLQDVHKLVEELTERLKKLKIVIQTHQSTPRKDQTLILKVCASFFFFIYMFDPFYLFFLLFILIINACVCFFRSSNVWQGN